MTTIQSLQNNLEQFESKLPHLMELASQYKDVPIIDFRNRGLDLNAGMDLKNKINTHESHIYFLKYIITHLEENNIRDNGIGESLTELASDDRSLMKYIKNNNLIQ